MLDATAGNAGETKGAPTELRMDHPFLSDETAEKMKDIGAAEEHYNAMRMWIRYMEPGRAGEIITKAQEWFDTRPAISFWDFMRPVVVTRNILLVPRGMNVLSPKMVPELMDEILVRQEYYFDSDNKAPYIIDAGANFGLASYYFKRLFRDARILAVDPAPEIAAVYRSNVERQQWQNVEFLEAAICAHTGKGVLSVQDDEDTASTLVLSRAKPGHRTVDVSLIALDDLIDRSVDMLKIDIEGSETVALEGAANSLRRIKYIVCECHTLSNGNSTLLPVLNVLNDAGFNTMVSRSPWAERNRRFQPMRHIQRPPSYTIYARRND